MLNCKFVWGIMFFFLSQVSAQTLKAIKRSPDPSFVSLGDTLILNVTYTYSGVDTRVGVTWRRNKTNLYEKGRLGGVDISDSRASLLGQATLVLNNTELDDNGTYSVELIAKTGDDVFQTFTVFIKEQPTAVINCNSSSPVPVKEGDHFECLCDSKSGNPPPTASWYKDGNLVSGPGYKKTTLSLKNITRNGTGNYSCVVESHNLNDTKSVEIEVLLTPIAVTNCSTSVTVKEGDDLKCLCYDTRGNPSPRALWYKDGKNIGEPKYLKKILSFKSISTEDAGNYSCLVNNTVFEDVKQIEIQVLLQPTAVINCNSSSPVTVKEGDHFECLCNSTSGNPPPTASWYKDGNLVSGPGFKKTTLSLKNITGNDTGNYSCFVESYNLNDTKSVEIEVLLKPTAVINCSTNVTVKEGDDFECLCYGTGGHPRPTASWYKDSRKVSGPEYLRETLSLKNISKEGAGNYSCIVNNSAFEDVKQVQIHVLHKPEINYFGSDQKNDMAIVGERVRITCKADGFPPPEYKIFHNSTKLTDVNDGVKTIVSANYNDSGQYKCIAKNSRGNKSEIFNLTVKELKRPNASVNCSSLVTKNRGDEFACLCVGNGGYPPPTASWFKDGKNVGGNGYLNKALSLKNISKNDKGTYSCVVDSHGLNDTEEIEIQVQYKPENISFDSNQTNNMVTVNKSITITCKADAFPSPNYTILHNDENLNDLLNGVKTFKSVKHSDNGSYICTAENVLGSASKDLILTVKGLPCDSAPCFNGGACKNKGEAFQCTCRPDYTGAQCQEYVGGLTPAEMVGITVGSVFFVILLVVLIWYVCKRNNGGACCRPKKERGVSELDLADHGIPNVPVAVHDNFNAYESVDQEKMRPNVEAGTSGDGEPARVDSPPSMPPVNAVGDKKLMKKKTPPDEEKPASGEDDNAAPAAASSILPAVYTAVDKVAQQKERDAKPAPLTYANLDPVLLQPDSSKMRDRSHEETNYAAIDMAKLQ